MDVLQQGAVIRGWTRGNPGGLPRGGAFWCDLDGYAGVREVLGFWCLSGHSQMRKPNPHRESPGNTDCRTQWKVNAFFFPDCRPVCRGREEVGNWETV